MEQTKNEDNRTRVLTHYGLGTLNTQQRRERLNAVMILLGLRSA